MEERHKVFQRASGLNHALETMGDPSGIFYFGGFAYDDSSEKISIDSAIYIAILANDIDRLSRDSIVSFNKMCEGFLRIENQIHNPTKEVVMYRTSKNGMSYGYRIPPEKHHIHMTDEELEPFRMTPEDEKETFGWMK